MATKKQTSGSNIIQLKRKGGTQRESEKKWGKRVIELGFSVVPSLLLRAQPRLGLTPTQMNILLQIADFWWEEGRKPFPSKKALSERLNIGERQIQRQIAELEKAGLVQRIERRAAHKGKLTNIYDLSGLVARLQELEPEFTAAEEKARKLRQQVARKGGLSAADLGTTQIELDD